MQQPDVIFCAEEQKTEHEECGEQLRENRCDGGALNAKSKDEDEKRVQQQVRDGADHNGEHAGSGIALGIDERVHAGGDHRWKRTEQVDHQIGIGVGQCIAGSAEQYENRPGK